MSGNEFKHLETVVNHEVDSKWETFKIKFKKYLGLATPSFLIAVAYIDPGNYATGTTAGATNRYSLLFIVLLSSIVAVFLQSICIKLGSVTGFDLARCCREYLPQNKWGRRMNWALWFFAECAIIATDLAEVIGTAIALNILLKIPLPAGVALTVVDVLFVLAAYKSDTASVKFLRYFEIFVGLLVLAVTICFAVELSQLPMHPGEVRDIFRGFAPSKQMIEGSGITVGASIIGATVMIHSLFLGSGIVQPRLREYDVKHGYVNLKHLEEKKISEADFFYNDYKPSLSSIKYSLKYSIISLAVTLCTMALFVNSAILVVSGNTLYGTDAAVDADLYTIHDLLSENLAPVAGTVFMLALLFSGQSAGISCTIAGQIVSEGHIKWTLKPWLRRLVTRSISIIPVLGIAIGIGRNGLNAALNISQFVISLLLPVLTLPLIYFTSNKKIMRIKIDDPSRGQFVKRNSGANIIGCDNNLLDDENTTSSSSIAINNTDESSNLSSEVSEENEDNDKYVYFHNHWVTTGFLLAIWLFVSVINVYSIYDLAAHGFMN